VVDQNNAYVMDGVVHGVYRRPREVTVVFKRENHSQEACLRPWMIFSIRKTREVPSATPLG
jgi:hypothetical protein